jgi:hypothetical protein
MFHLLFGQGTSEIMQRTGCIADIYARRTRDAPQGCVSALNYRENGSRAFNDTIPQGMQRKGHIGRFLSNLAGLATKAHGLIDQPLDVVIQPVGRAVAVAASRAVGCIADHKGGGLEGDDEDYKKR